MSAPAAVEVSGLSYRYAAGGPWALESLSLSVPPGILFGLLGPNGSGKTTLFRLLATALIPSSGSIRLLGRDARAERAAARRLLGVVFQSPSLDKRLSVAENLRHQGHLYGLSGALLRERVSLALERFGLAPLREEQAGRLSGGWQRRVELAKSLLHGPRLLLLDEPSTGLDPGARKDLWDQLGELCGRDGTSVLVTTHWMEEAERCGRLAILHEGRLVAEGSPAELKAAVGAEVLNIETAQPARVLAGLRAMGLEAAEVDGVLRLESPSGHALVPRIAEAFGGLIESMTLGRATLEDVFIRKTGHRFWRGRGEGA